MQSVFGPTIARAIAATDIWQDEESRMSDLTHCIKLKVYSDLKEPAVITLLLNEAIARSNIASLPT